MIDADDDRLEALERRARIDRMLIVEVVLGLTVAVVVLTLVDGKRPYVAATIGVALVLLGAGARIMASRLPR